MPKRVYIESTIISYMTARPSPDLIAAGRQQITRLWWEQNGPAFDLFISDLVVAEVEEGDPEAANQRITMIEGLPRLPITDSVLNLAKSLTGPVIIPAKAAEDAIHLARATIHGMDFLLTWNLRHLANASIAVVAYNTLRRLGYKPPLICTPEELQGSYP